MRRNDGEWVWDNHLPHMADIDQMVTVQPIFNVKHVHWSSDFPIKSASNYTSKPSYLSYSNKKKAYWPLSWAHHMDYYYGHTLYYCYHVSLPMCTAANPLIMKLMLIWIWFMVNRGIDFRSMVSGRINLVDFRHSGILAGRGQFWGPFRFSNSNLVFWSGMANWGFGMGLGFN